ncbi:MAG TPA: GNAT family N-acetyltransferase [Acidimicrobiia bacterium]|nr:GNAT family N-acetyltransferase [Acidimicrobiia bacterium]
MNATSLGALVALAKLHDVSQFSCGTDELDVWLRDHSWTNHVSGTARVFVAARRRVVVAYYALATVAVEKAAAPEELIKGRVPSELSCLLLARLAVDSRAQGKSLGREMLLDAIRRATRVSERVGIRALLVHAISDDARAFYLHHAEFVPSPTDPLHLVLPLKQG